MPIQEEYPRHKPSPQHTRPSREDVLKYACPVCDAMPQEWCSRKLDGRDLKKTGRNIRDMANRTPPSHRERYDLAQGRPVGKPRRPDTGVTRMMALGEVVAAVGCPVHSVPKGTRCPVGGDACQVRKQKFAQQAPRQRKRRHRSSRNRPDKRTREAARQAAIAAPVPDWGPVPEVMTQAEADALLMVEPAS